MTYSVKVSSQLQMSLPVEVAKILHLKPGMRIVFSSNPSDPQSFIIQNGDDQINNLAGMVLEKVKKNAPEMLGISDEKLEDEIQKSKQTTFAKRKI